ncbi:MAG TPA: hypothetical protein VK699_12335 [Terriglobales bacterium]|nr:hypothetical protein [Terriglobales bacterium]
MIDVVAVIHSKRFQTVELEHSSLEPLKPSSPDSDPRLRVTVIFTTPEGTLAALRTARDLARNLGFRISLVIAEVVPFHFPLDRPPVSIDFLKQRSLALVSKSDVEAEQVNIELYFCRDRKQCLQRILVPNSVVVIGGRKQWLIRRERKLEAFIRSHGHRVISVDTKFKSGNKARHYIHADGPKLYSPGSKR